MQAPLAEIDRQITDTGNELSAMLDELTGNKDDISGLEELKNYSEKLNYDK